MDTTDNLSPQDISPQEHNLVSFAVRLLRVAIEEYISPEILQDIHPSNDLNNVEDLERIVRKVLGSEIRTVLEIANEGSEGTAADRAFSKLREIASSLPPLPPEVVHTFFAQLDSTVPQAISLFATPDTGSARLDDGDDDAWDPMCPAHAWTEPSEDGKDGEDGDRVVDTLVCADCGAMDPCDDPCDPDLRPPIVPGVQDGFLLGQRCLVHRLPTGNAPFDRVNGFGVIRSIEPDGTCAVQMLWTDDAKHLQEVFRWPEADLRTLDPQHAIEVRTVLVVGWVYTEGLWALGLPELEVRDVPTWLSVDVTGMLVHVARFMMYAGTELRHGDTVMFKGGASFPRLIRFLRLYPIDADEAHRYEGPKDRLCLFDDPRIVQWCAECGDLAEHEWHGTPSGESGDGPVVQDDEDDEEIH